MNHIEVLRVLGELKKGINILMEKTEKEQEALSHAIKCCEVVERLPNEDEMMKIIQKELLKALQYCGDGVRWLNERERKTISDYIFKAISKRIRGEKVNE